MRQAAMPLSPRLARVHRAVIQQRGHSCLSTKRENPTATAFAALGALPSQLDADIPSASALLPSRQICRFSFPSTLPRAKAIHCPLN